MTVAGTSSRPAVVVFGSTSYLGQYVLRDLLDREYRVVALTRNPAISSILLREFERRVTVCRAEDLPADLGEVSAVVNLAYVKTERPHRLMRQNAALARSVDATVRRLGARRLLHASTMAVFGYEFDGEPQPVPARRRYGDPYIESKIAAETMLRALAAEGRYALALLRLGNIIGPGSPVWAANLAQRLLEGRPVGVAGRDGYSNAALAANIASYFGHLVTCSESALGSFGEFHHVAEFSATRWSAFVDGFAGRMQVAPVRVDGVPVPASPALRWLLAAKLKATYAGRLGGYARAAFGAIDAERIADRLLFSAKTALVGGTLGGSHYAVPADRDLLAILSSTRQFRSHVLPDWTPPLSLEEAMAAMLTWLDEAGFALSTAHADRHPGEAAG